MFYSYLYYGIYIYILLIFEHTHEIVLFLTRHCYHRHCYSVYYYHTGENEHYHITGGGNNSNGEMDEWVCYD